MNPEVLDIVGTDFLLLLIFIIQLISVILLLKGPTRKNTRNKGLWLSILFLMILLVVIVLIMIFLQPVKVDSFGFLYFIFMLNTLLAGFLLFKIWTLSNKLNDAEKEKNSCRNMFTALFQNSSDEIIISDLHGNILEYNDLVPIELGYSAEELLNMNLQKICTCVETISIDSFVEKIRNEELVFESEFRKKDSSLYPVEIKSRLIRRFGKEVILIMSRNIYERKQVESQILNAIIETEQKERERFSKDLHDQLGNILSSMNIYCELIRSSTIDELDRENLMGYFKGLLHEAIASTREIANNLNPNTITKFGLIHSIQLYCKQINQTGLLKIYLSTDIKAEISNKELEVNLYKIVKELISNTLKHAHADRVYIALMQVKEKLLLKYEDNGIGFDYQGVLKSPGNGMGLLNVTSRVAALGGKMDVESNKTIGTRISIFINQV